MACMSNPYRRIPYEHTLYTHPAPKADTSAGHPERIARIEAVNEALAGDSGQR